MNRLFFILIIGLAACKSKPPQQSELPQPIPDDSIAYVAPRNVVFMIGDGMSLAQITALNYSNGNRTVLEEFPYTALQKPFSATSRITDSAAAATAFACGVRTQNGVVGMDTSGKPVTNLFELAQAAGIRTGLVVTSSITHATPAAFYAHQPSRDLNEAIASDLLRANVDCIVGGGMAYFGLRQDGKNLLDSLRQRGYALADTTQPLTQFFKNARAERLIYFTALYEPPSRLEDRTYLSQATHEALWHLKRIAGDKGFILVVEGSQIDWAGHDNDLQRLTLEMEDFEQAIGAALDFAHTDGQTLVIVTGDHETGGLALLPGSEMGNVNAGFATTGHTAQLVPVFAKGPGQELFSGVFDNTAIFHKIRRLLNLGAPPQQATLKKQPAN